MPRNKVFKKLGRSSGNMRLSTRSHVASFIKDDDNLKLQSFGTASRLEVEGEKTIPIFKINLPKFVSFDQFQRNTQMTFLVLVYVSSFAANLHLSTAHPKTCVELYN